MSAIQAESQIIAVLNELRKNEFQVPGDPGGATFEPIHSPIYVTLFQLTNGVGLVELGFSGTDVRLLDSVNVAGASSYNASLVDTLPNEYQWQLDPAGALPVTTIADSRDQYAPSSLFYVSSEDERNEVKHMPVPAWEEVRQIYAEYLEAYKDHENYNRMVASLRLGLGASAFAAAHPFGLLKQAATYLTHAVYPADLMVDAIDDEELEQALDNRGDGILDAGSFADDDQVIEQAVADAEDAMVEDDTEVVDDLHSDTSAGELLIEVFLELRKNAPQFRKAIENGDHIGNTVWITMGLDVADLMQATREETAERPAVAILYEKVFGAVDSEPLDLSVWKKDPLKLPSEVSTESGIELPSSSMPLVEVDRELTLGEQTLIAGSDSGKSGYQTAEDAVSAVVTDPLFTEAPVAAAEDTVVNDNRRGTVIAPGMAMEGDHQTPAFLSGDYRIDSKRHDAPLLPPPVSARPSERRPPQMSVEVERAFLETLLRRHLDVGLEDVERLLDEAREESQETRLNDLETRLTKLEQSLNKQ